MLKVLACVNTMLTYAITNILKVCTMLVSLALKSTELAITKENLTHCCHKA